MKNKFIRVVSLFLLLFMVQLPLLAAEVGEEVPIPNPSFEEVSGDWVASWSHMNTEDATFKVDAKIANTGTNSIYISTKKNVNPWALTSIKGLQPGCFYELSMYINAAASGSGAGNKLEFYSSEKTEQATSLDRSAIANVYPDGQFLTQTNGRFVQHRTIFQVPENTKVVKLYLRLYGAGEAWFDDVSLKLSGGPQKYKFDTDKVFHYKEETGGDAYVKVDNFYKDEGVAEDTVVDFAVYYGDTICEQAENVPVTDMQALFTYSTSYMTPYEKYVLKCKIKNRAGAVLEEHEQNLYVVDRPSMISEDGYLMVDGKRFNPIIGYHVQLPDYAKAAEGGLNTVQLSYGNAKVSNEEARQQTLAALRENNLKGIFCLYVDNRNAGQPEQIENTKQIVEIMKDNTDILAFAIQDEPFLKGDDPDRRKWSEEAYLAIRKIDKTHPVYICDKSRDYISVKYCDILISDNYSRGGNTQRISLDTAETYAETKDKNKFWYLSALYEANGTFPTMNDARNSIYRALEEGATGMGYYSFSDAGGKDVEEPQLYKMDLWEDFCKFNNEEAPILFDRFVNGNAVVFNEYDDGEGITSLKWFDWYVGNDMYLAVHNRAQNAKTAEIPLVSKNGKVRIADFTAEPIGLTTQSAMNGNGSITLTLGAEEIAIFKINPSSKVDLSRLEEARFDDLAGYEWAEEAIFALDSRNVLNTVAEGKYSPSEAITRLDFVSFLVRALGLTEEGEAFPDCDAKEIKIARKAGIVNGNTDGNFRPADTITRQDIMTTAARALGAVPTDKEIPVFSDWNLVSAYASDAVKCMVQAEVIVGNGDGSLNPLGLATRAEAAVMLHRILNTEFNTTTGKPGAPTTTEKPSTPAPGEVREEITFTDSVDEQTLQKWSDAADLLEGLGIGKPEIEKSVTKGDFEGYISSLIGAAYDGFSEDLKALTYAEATEALVKLLGYEAYANANGGYLAMAARLELTDGISPGEYIRGGELAVLLSNAFEVKMAERTAFGDDESYRETEDTLLSLYRNIYQYKGVVEDDYYTAARLKKGQTVIDGKVFTGGEGFLGQCVVVYAEHDGDEKIVRHIKAANGVEIVTLDTKEILTATDSMVRFDDANGKEVTLSIAGATLYYNGAKKAPWTANDLLPAMGTVTLISNTDGGADTILVEAYENRIVQSAYGDNNTVYFKNASEIILDKNNMSSKFEMDFEVAELKEWNVLSVLLRANGTPYKVKLSTESAIGAPSEISADGVQIGETVYAVAANSLGTPVLGETAKYYLDFNGKIAAVDTTNVTPEYGYFTAMAQEKGIDGGVSLRIFTKQGEMKIFKAAKSVKLNGTPTNAADLLTAPVLLEGGKAKEQLVVYELSGSEEVIALETAEDALDCTHKNAPNAFSKVLVTEGRGTQYHGHGQNTLSAAYRIMDNTLTFIVPETASDDVRDYSVKQGNTWYEHGESYENSELYDWHADFGVGAVVRKVSSSLADVSDTATIGVVLSVGDALDDDGNVGKAIRVLVDGNEEVIFAEEDFRVVLNANTLTDVNNGETQVTQSGSKKVLNPSMPVSALSRGDVVIYSLGGVQGDVLTGMRALLRADSPRVGENGASKLYQYYFYSSMTIAYGKVTEVLEDGLSMFTGQYDRLILHYSNGSRLSPVVIYDRATDTIKPSTIDAIRAEDMVFTQKINPYTKLIVAYR